MAPNRKSIDRSCKPLISQVNHLLDDGMYRHFNVADFFETFGDPVAYFTNPERVLPRCHRICSEYAEHILKAMFPTKAVKDIREGCCTEPNIVAASKKIHRLNRCLKAPRSMSRFGFPIDGICREIKREITYLLNVDKIEAYYIEAKKKGLFVQCECCYDEHVYYTKAVTCVNAHLFCEACVKKSVEVKLSEGVYDFACLAECSGHFSEESLARVVDRTTVSKIGIAQSRLAVESAGFSGLRSCLFCDYAYDADPQSRFFFCLNPACKRVFCLRCKHEHKSEDPCETDEETKKRVHVENEMTEALVRTCYKCGRKFVKTEGCNKMTCICGALQCYLCRKPVKDYTHFNGPGGTNLERCPLFSDTERMHRMDVDRARIKGVEETGYQLVQ